MHWQLPASVISLSGELKHVKLFCQADRDSWSWFDIRVLDLKKLQICWLCQPWPQKSQVWVTLIQKPLSVWTFLGSLNIRNNHGPDFYIEYSVCLIKLQIFPDLGIFNCLVICVQMMTGAKYIIYFTYSFHVFLEYGALIFFNGSHHLFHILKSMSTQFLDLNNLSIPNHLQHSGLKKLIDKL